MPEMFRMPGGGAADLGERLSPALLGSVSLELLVLEGVGPSIDQWRRVGRRVAGRVRRWRGGSLPFLPPWAGRRRRDGEPDPTGSQRKVSAPRSTAAEPRDGGAERLAMLATEYHWTGGWRSAHRGAESRRPVGRVVEHSSSDTCSRRASAWPPGRRQRPGPGCHHSRLLDTGPPEPRHRASSKVHRRVQVTCRHADIFRARTTPGCSTPCQPVQAAGFVFPSAEIYGGIRSTYDYGPLALYARNVREAWWRAMIQERDESSIDAAYPHQPKVWRHRPPGDVHRPLVDCPTARSVGADQDRGRVPQFGSKT